MPSTKESITDIYGKLTGINNRLTNVRQAASIHNDLGGLQGGQADEYYHLNATEHPYVSGANAQSLLTTASPSFVNITDTGNERTRVAAGTTGQRAAGVVGDVRYNSTLGAFEVYTGAWESILLSGDVGIADDNILSVDGVAVANDYAKFTAAGLVGRSYDEVLSDLSGEALAAFDFNSQNLTGCGNITMGQFLNMTHATATVIRPSVDSGQMTIYGSINPNEGAKIEFFGGDHAGTPGNIYLDYGDFTKAAPAGAIFNIRAMDNGATITALRLSLIHI